MLGQKNGDPKIEIRVVPSLTKELRWRCSRYY